MKIQNTTEYAAFGISRIKAPNFTGKLCALKATLHVKSDLVLSMETSVRPIKPNCAELIKLNDGTIVGNIQYSIETTPTCFVNLLPDNWLIKCRNGYDKIKPYLWLDKIIMDSEKRGHGFGREAMKRLYIESMQRGGEGRMMCYSDWGSHDFYAKTGWEIIGRDSYISTLEEKILHHALNVKNLQTDPSKKDEVEFSKSVIKNCKEELEKVKLGRPYQDDKIIFNPTKKNIEMLFCM